jgi:4-amino-4-deoxy-L-arabinose transferase-like glycosyltransferase
MAIVIFLLALTVRVIDLGQFLTTDEPESWLGRSMAFMLAILEGRLGDTFFHYSPGVTLMWSGAAGLFLAYLFEGGQAPGFAEFLRTLPFDPIAPSVIFWFRLPNVIIGAACIAISYPLASKLTGTMIALIGALLLVFDPLFIGMNRLLGHDGLAASLMMVSALAAIYYFVRQPVAGYWFLALSGLAAGLAILAKSTAFYIFPFVFFVAIFAALYQRQPRQLKSYFGRSCGRTRLEQGKTW